MIKKRKTPIDIWSGWRESVLSKHQNHFMLIALNDRIDDISGTSYLHMVKRLTDIPFKHLLIVLGPSGHKNCVICDCPDHAIMGRLNGGGEIRVFDLRDQLESIIAYYS